MNIPQTRPARERPDIIPIIPITGTKRRAFLEENAAAANLILSAQDLARIEQVAPRGVAAGPRYTESAMKMVNG
jgi:aryl-alcohol dehydrogenase-like predicted oxidoreductase